MVATTPEGKIKSKVSAMLQTMKSCWYDMPVPSGFGKSTLDYIGCANGRFFSVETKAPGKKPTARQNAMIASMERAGGVVFVIDGQDGLDELLEWLLSVGAHRPIETPPEEPLT